MARNLTETERLLLANQCRILERLIPEEADHYKSAAVVLENGYTLDYSDVFSSVSDELGEEECREVTAVLSMFRALRSAYDGLQDKANIDLNRITFAGFDGNEESRSYHYARFLVETPHNWDDYKGKELNSHHNVLPRYRSMLRAWEASPKKHELTTEDIARIAAAGQLS
jgi:uncharacterized protein YfbU (UPF0304 family)